MIENLKGGDGRPRCHANHTHPVVPSPDDPGHRGAMTGVFSRQEVRLVPERAAAGVRVKIVPQVDVEVVDTLIDNHHVDSGSLGGCPGVAQIDVLP